MDRRVGIVLKELEKEKLLDDTIIIVFGDNGRVDHRSIHWVYDTGLHAPMIIKWPKNFPMPEGFKPGTVNEEVISLLDLTATTLYLAGVPRPLGMQSRIFLGKTGIRKEGMPSVPGTVWTTCLSACARSAASATITSGTTNPSSTSEPTSTFTRRSASRATSHARTLQERKA